MLLKRQQKIQTMASAEAAINRKRKRQVKHLSFPSHFLFAIFNLLSEDLLFLLRSLFENISVIITSKILTNFHWSTGFEIKQYSYQNFHYSVQKTDYLYLSPYLSPTPPPPKKNPSVTHSAYIIIRKRLEKGSGTACKFIKERLWPKCFPVSFTKFFIEQSQLTAVLWKM